MLGLGKDYGPNGAQVRRFIDRVICLTPSEWNRVAAAADVALAAYESPDWRHIQLDAIERYGYERSERFPAAASRSLKSVEAPTSRHWGLAHGAVVALVNAELMTPVQFAATYAAFVEVIPVESLGAGMAPDVAEPPDSVCGRFITRLKCLEAPEWQQALDIAATVGQAVGSDAGGVALEVAATALKSIKEADLTAAEKAEFTAAMEAIDHFGEEHAEGMADVSRIIARTINRESWADAKIAETEEFVEDVHRAARTAIAALFVRDLIEPNHFAVLYAPFTGLIPLRSLEVQSLYATGQGADD